MHPILRNERLSPNVTRLVLEAPRIAEIRQPGPFVIVHLGRGAERIPLTIADGDAEAGTISLVIQAIGKSTTDLVEVPVGGAIADVAGPLGRPTELPESGRVVCVGGGVGTAVILPIAQELHRRGVAVTSIIGGRSREWVIMEAELGACGEVVPCTDDGSDGLPGFVTPALAHVLAGGVGGQGLQGGNINLDIEMSGVGEHTAVLHHLEVRDVDHVLVARSRDDKVGLRGGDT